MLVFRGRVRSAEGFGGAADDHISDEPSEGDQLHAGKRHALRKGGRLMVIREEDQCVVGQPSPTLQDLLDLERVPVPASLRSQSVARLGTEDIDKQRYLSREFHDLEVERLWKRVWQLVCREDEIPSVGDTFVYEIADLSVLVVRCAPDLIKAYPNACLHRGRQLRSSSGKVTELRCGFHGFCWRLDGTLKDIPCAWDFGHVAGEDFHLPELRVDTCDGFVFVNMDPHAPSLKEYLGGLVEHLAEVPRPRMADRFMLAHIAKPIRANWKVGIEAFIETMHVPATHPQLALMLAEANAQVDVYTQERHWSRVITPLGLPSSTLGSGVDPQDVADSLVVDFMGADSVPIPRGGTARETMAVAVAQMLGLDAAGVTQSQVLDSIAYFVFPNTLLILALGSMAISFRPYGNDPNMCLMELRFLSPVPPGAERPPAAPAQWLEADDSFTEHVPILGEYGLVMDQDTGNMQYVQRGLRASAKPGVTLSNYLESSIRNMHRVLDEYVLFDRGGTAG